MPIDKFINQLIVSTLKTQIDRCVDLNLLSQKKKAAKNPPFETRNNPCVISRNMRAPLHSSCVAQTKCEDVIPGSGNFQSTLFSDILWSKRIFFLSKYLHDSSGFLSAAAVFSCCQEII